MRFGALAIFALVAGALIAAPWVTLSIITGLYLLAIPFGMRSYARIKRSRRAAGRAGPPVKRDAIPS